MAPLSSRPLEIAAFLDRCGWGEAQTHPLSGDFSTRNYARLTKQAGETAFLMDADSVQKTPQFVALAGLLRNLGLRAPEIYADDAPE
ncbi:MAG: phosphotransferase, partial [Alphaproteobacteria bacterium]|nr:phosphotransferase [Alphaproteobacteria bacterium]